MNESIHINSEKRSSCHTRHDVQCAALENMLWVREGARAFFSVCHSHYTVNIIDIDYVLSFCKASAFFVLCHTVDCCV